MRRYEITSKLGDGTYGSVVKGIDSRTGEEVAIKKLKRKFHSWEECVALREVQSLRNLCHPHVVQIREVIREDDSSLYFVFEFMQDGNLYDLIKSRNGISFPPSEIRKILSQVLKGVSFMHSRGIFHRDIKPENLLMRRGTCKVADFGLAKEVRSLPPFTEYVSTRWYRAPEVLLRAPRYNAPIDLFAIGCVMAEMYNLHPLFPGETEIDQVIKIFGVLGTPTMESWLEGVQLSMKMNLRFLQAPLKGIPLQNIISNTSPQSVALLGDLLKLDPVKRVTATKALEYSYFQPKTTASLPLTAQNEQPCFEKTNVLSTRSFPNFQAANFNKRSHDTFTNTVQFGSFQNDSMDFNPYKLQKVKSRRSSFPMPSNTLTNAPQISQPPQNAPISSSSIFRSSQFGPQTLDMKISRRIFRAHGNFITSSSSSSSDEETVVPETLINSQRKIATKKGNNSQKQALAPHPSNATLVQRLPEWPGQYSQGPRNRWNEYSPTPLLTSNCSNLHKTFVVPKNTTSSLSHSFSNRTLGSLDKSSSEGISSMGGLEYFSNVRGASNVNKNSRYMQSMSTSIDLENKNNFHMNPDNFDDMQTPRIPSSFPGFGRRKQR